MVFFFYIGLCSSDILDINPLLDSVIHKYFLPSHRLPFHPSHLVDDFLCCAEAFSDGIPCVYFRSNGTLYKVLGEHRGGFVTCAGVIQRIRKGFTEIYLNKDSKNCDSLDK